MMTDFEAELERALVKFTDNFALDDSLVQGFESGVRWTLQESSVVKELVETLSELLEVESDANKERLEAFKRKYEVQGENWNLIGGDPKKNAAYYAGQRALEAYERAVGGKEKT